MNFDKVNINYCVETKKYYANKRTKMFNNSFSVEDNLILNWENKSYFVIGKKIKTKTLNPKHSIDYVKYSYLEIELLLLKMNVRFDKIVVDILFSLTNTSEDVIIFLDGNFNDVIHFNNKIEINKISYESYNDYMKLGLNVKHIFVNYQSCFKLKQFYFF